MVYLVLPGFYLVYPVILESYQFQLVGYLVHSVNRVISIQFNKKDPRTIIDGWNEPSEMVDSIQQWKFNDKVGVLGFAVEEQPPPRADAGGAQRQRRRQTPERLLFAGPQGRPEGQRDGELVRRQRRRLRTAGRRADDAPGQRRQRPPQLLGHGRPGHHPRQDLRL